MKRKVLFLLPILLLCLSPFATTAHAGKVLAQATQVSLSDAIYADLAIRGDLDNVSVFYSNGKAVNDVRLNETRHWLPASTVKLFAAMYTYKQIADGKLHLTDTATIDPKNQVTTELVTDELPTLQIGDTVTIDRLIRQMITQSDNTAYNQLLDILGRDNITAYIQSLGLKESHVGSKLNLDDSQTQYEYDAPGYGINSTTASDYALAFSLIKNNKIPGAKDLYNVLLQQKINNMIPLYLPKTVACAHKTGDLDPIYHDGGICQDKTHSFILTIFTNAGDPNLLGHIAEIAYTQNYQLVGESTTTSNGLTQNTQPIDALVMNQPTTAVLGAATPHIDFPVPDITAADLGITASDLSLVLPSSKLPQVTIPADSPFHALSNIVQLTKYITAVGQQGRMDVSLQTAELRLAEAKDLQKRGKSQQAQAVIGTVQQGLTSLAKDPIVTTNAANQTAIQAISETRFSLLGGQLQQATGDSKLQLIKQIAQEAKETIQQVQPHIPEAVNATSPTQKPLIGTVVSSTPTTVTVQTAGGQQITIPTNTTATIAEKSPLVVSPTPSTTLTPTTEISGEVSITPSVMPSVTPTPGIATLQTGTTVALVGSTVNNHFTPSYILANVPKELAAPQPVTVTKVDTVHNTMVVNENGVYTQVDINQNTTIKGADTNIPLKSIQAGDVVVVHGAPLTQTQPTPSTTPTVSESNSPTTSISPVKSSGTPVSATPATSPNTTTSPSITVIPSSLTPIPKITVTPIVSGKLIPSPTSTSKITIAPTSVPTKTTIPTVTTPPVIQGTSVQVVEQKANITNTPIQPVSKPSTPQPPQPQKSQPVQQSAPVVPVKTAQPTKKN